MRLDTLIIAMLIGSLFIVGSTQFFSSYVNNYDKVGMVNGSTESLAANFSGVYDIIDASYNQSQDIKNQILGNDTIDEDNPWDSLIKGSYSALKLISTSFNLIGEIANALADGLKVPRFIVTTIMTVLLVSILFSIIYMVFRFKG